MDITNRIKTIRGNLTQDEFAQRLKIHKNSLGRYERGDSTPDLNFAHALCSEFSVSPEWFLFGTGPMFTTDKVTTVRATAGRLRAGAPIATNVAMPDPSPEGSTDIRARLATLEAQVTALKAENAMLREVQAAKEESLQAYKEMLRMAQGGGRLDMAELARHIETQERMVEFFEGDVRQSADNLALAAANAKLTLELTAAQKELEALRSQNEQGHNLRVHK